MSYLQMGKNALTVAKDIKIISKNKKRKHG